MIKQLLGALAGVLLAVACGGGDNEDEDFTCALGELAGTWRLHYVETDGTCGPIEDQSGIFNPGEPAPGCTLDSRIISADKCRLDTAFTCPLADGLAFQGWTIVLTQVASGRLSGTGTAELNHPSAGSCRSTYDIMVTRL
jgi:hypothetical protein